MKTQIQNLVKLETLKYNSNQELLFGEVNLPKWIKSHHLNSNPFYLYSDKILQNRVKTFEAKMKENLGSNYKTFYAMKANSHPHILKTMKKNNIGLDVVSLGEMKLALKAGFDGDDIIFSGVGKTVEEIKTAIKLQMNQINVESLPELSRIGVLAKKLNKKTNIALRLNPEVNPITHKYIATGMRKNKFGINLKNLDEALRIIKSHSYLNLKGVSLHIGSQLFDFSALEEAIVKLKATYEEVNQKGFSLETFDVGGGVGVPYLESSKKDILVLNKFSQVIKKSFKNFHGKIYFEPGRYLVARAGALIGEVQYVKKTPHKTFVILNTGMNHLLRPALYQAEHNIFCVKKRTGKLQKVEVVGPVCESSDILGENRMLSKIEEGDWILIADAGAYGFSMSSSYNSFDLPKEKWLDLK